MYTTRALDNIKKLEEYDLSGAFKARQLKINAKYVQRISKMQEALKNLTKEFNNHEVDEVAYTEEKEALETKLEAALEDQEKQIEMAAAAEQLTELDKEKYQLEVLKEQEQVIDQAKNTKQAKIPRFIKNIFRKVAEAYRYSIGYDINRIGKKIKEFVTLPEEDMSPKKEEYVELETPINSLDDANKKLEEIGRLIQERSAQEQEQVKLTDLTVEDLKTFVEKENKENPTISQSFKTKLENAKANKEKVLNTQDIKIENETTEADPTANINEERDVDTVEYADLKKDETILAQEEEIDKQEEEEKVQEEEVDKVEEAKKEASIFTEWAQYEQQTKEQEVQKEEIVADLNKITPTMSVSNMAPKINDIAPIEVGAALKPFLEQEEVKETTKKNEDFTYTDKDIIDAFNELAQSKEATVEDYKALTAEIRRVNFKEEIEEKKNEIFSEMITKEEEINKDNSQLTFNLFDSHKEELQDIAEKQALESLDALTR